MPSQSGIEARVMNRKKILKLALSCIISFGLLGWVLSEVNFEEVKSQLPLVRWWILILMIPLMVIHFWIRALRWRLLLPGAPEFQYRTSQLNDGILVGNLASFIFPLRLGEFVRPFVISKWSGVSFSAAFVSVVVERLFDLCAVLMSFAIISNFLVNIPPLLYKGALSFGVLALGIMAFLLIAALLPSLCKSLINFGCNFLPIKIANLVKKISEDVLAGAAAIKNPTRLISVVALTAGVWITAFMHFYLFAYLILDSVPLLLPVTTTVFVSLAVALPSAPGFIGVYQKGVEVAYVLLGYSTANALIVAIISHLFYYVYYIVAGIYGLNRNQMSFSEMGKFVKSRQGAE